MNALSDKARKRILGSKLSQNVGQSVCLMGTLVQSDSNGRVLKMKTSDDQIVTVQLQQPITEPVESVIEVQGTVSSNNSVQCSKLISFEEDLTKNFDFTMYNEAVDIMSTNPERYVTVN